MAVCSIYNVSNIDNLGLATFHGGDILNHHKPWSHPKGQKFLNIPKKPTASARGSRRYIDVSSMSSSADATITTSMISTSTYSIEAASTSAMMGLSSSDCLPLLWREIHGCNNWQELLDPLHPLLRDEIIRYGEFVNACYEAFDLNPSSRRYLNCKFGKKSLFQEVGLGKSGYEVTKYIYATPDVSIPIQNGDSCTSRWIGYVAVSTDEAVRRLGRRDVVITFRGTVTNPEWIANLMSSLTPARLDPHDSCPDVKVELGFLSLYTSEESACKFRVRSCREQLLSEVSRLLTKYNGENMSITLAGHSMGSSLALLLAYDLAELGLNRTNNTVISTNLDDGIVPITVFSYGGPRVGNSAFKERCEELGIKVLRIVNVNDPITKLPGVVFNENFRVLGGIYELPWSCSCYTHVGVKLALDFFNVQNPSCVHDLESYLSLLKSPKKPEIQSESIMPMADFLQRAQDFLVSAQNFNNMIPWRNAALNMANLIPIGMQSQRML